MGSFYDWVVSLRSVSLSVIKLFRSFPVMVISGHGHFRSFSFFNQWLISVIVISGHYRFCNPCLIFAPKLLNQHALKGQKILAQGNALGYYGCKPVALKGQKLSSQDNIL